MSFTKTVCKKAGILLLVAFILLLGGMTYLNAKYLFTPLTLPAEVYSHLKLTHASFPKQATVLLETQMVQTPDENTSPTQLGTSGGKDAARFFQKNVRMLADILSESSFVKAELAKDFYTDISQQNPILRLKLSSGNGEIIRASFRETGSYININGNYYTFSESQRDDLLQLLQTQFTALRRGG